MLEEYPRPAASTLLAFKPMVFVPGKGFASYHSPEIIWEPAHKIIAEDHNGHIAPKAGCDCGILSTVDVEAVEKFLAANPFHIWENGAPIVLLGVIQVLGPAIVEDLRIRSHGAFLWGIVKNVGDEYMQPYWDHMMYYYPVRAAYDPVYYQSFADAAPCVLETAERYGIK